MKKGKARPHLIHSLQPYWNIYLRNKIDEIKKIKEDLNQARVELESGNVYFHFGTNASCTDQQLL